MAKLQPCSYKGGHGEFTGRTKLQTVNVIIGDIWKHIVKVPKVFLNYEGLNRERCPHILQIGLILKRILLLYTIVYLHL